jgi:hypothetical protein
MTWPKRLVLLGCAAALAGTSPTAAADPSDVGGGTRVPLKSVLRRCDGSAIQAGVPPPSTSGKSASVSAVIRVGGGTVVAQVDLVDTSALNTHFDVGLIQEPRPAGATCGPGDPGTTFGSFDTDGAGRATTTLRGAIAPGTTGVFVLVQRPGGHSQSPDNYYSSEFIAPV